MPFRRPKELADDQTITVPVIGHAVQWFIDQGQAPDAACCIYPCVPLLQAQDLRNLGIHRVEELRGADPQISDKIYRNMSKRAGEILRAWGNGLRPDPDLTVSEWADRHRMLSGRASAEPGRYRTVRTPYMREIMDRLSPGDAAQRIVFMKAAQVGATEAGNNWIGFAIGSVAQIA